MALKVKLVRSMSGHPESHRATLRGMGLTKVGRERLLPDNQATRGMIEKVAWAVEVQETSDEFKPFGRRSRAKSQREAAKATGKPA
jgi:large subunit ribosomal protein L30